MSPPKRLYSKCDELLDELTEDCRNGIKRYFELALEMGIFQHSGSLQFYEK